MRQRKSKNPDVAIIHDKDEQKAIETGLNKLNISKLICETDNVVIVPNWVNPTKPDPKDAVVVGQNSLKQVIEVVKGCNPKKVTVATGSGGDKTTNIMKLVGYDLIIAQTGVDFIDLNTGPYFDLSLNHPRPSATKINKIIEEADVILSFTQLKTHEEATMSAAIKNIALGLPPAEIHGHPKKDLGIHDDLHGFIVAMAERIPIDISVVSCNPAMVGSGPTNGISKHTHLVICGTDPVATDTVGARLLGYKTQGVHYLYKCEQLKLGEACIDKINFKGLSIQKAEKLFSEAVYGEKVVID